MLKIVKIETGPWVRLLKEGQVYEVRHFKVATDVDGNSVSVLDEQHIEHTTIKQLED